MSSAALSLVWWTGLLNGNLRRPDHFRRTLPPPGTPGGVSPEGGGEGVARRSTGPNGQTDRVLTPKRPLVYRRIAFILLYKNFIINCLPFFLRNGVSLVGRIELRLRRRVSHFRRGCERALLAPHTPRPIQRIKFLSFRRTHVEIFALVGVIGESHKEV